MLGPYHVTEHSALESTGALGLNKLIRRAKNVFAWTRGLFLQNDAFPSLNDVRWEPQSNFYKPENNYTGIIRIEEADGDFIYFKVRIDAVSTNNTEKTKWRDTYKTLQDLKSTLENPTKGSPGSSPPAPQPGAGAPPVARVVLPPGWTELTDKDGQTYYENDISKNTQWEVPSA